MGQMFISSYIKRMFKSHNFPLSDQMEYMHHRVIWEMKFYNVLGKLINIKDKYVSNIVNCTFNCT